LGGEQKKKKKIKKDHKKNKGTEGEKQQQIYNKDGHTSVP